MDIKLLKSDILTNNIPKFLIFIEEEPALSKQYIVSMSNTLNKAYKYYDSADEVIYDATTNLREDFLYVIFNDEKIVKNPTYISSLANLNRNIVACFPQIDKSSDFFRSNKSNIVVFERLDKYSLLAYAQKMCKTHKTVVEQDKLLEIIECCDCRLGALMNELDKIFTLGQDNSNLLVDYLLKNGFPDYRNVNIYEFINCVLSRNKYAFRMALKIDDSPVGIVFAMYNKARVKLVDSRHPFYGYVMECCYEIYNRIIDGTLNDQYALQYLLHKVFTYEE